MKHNIFKYDILITHKKMEVRRGVCHANANVWQKIFKCDILITHGKMEVRWGVWLLKDLDNYLSANSRMLYAEENFHLPL